MLRKSLVLALLVAGCSKGPEADLQYIGQARSLAAEWAMVNELAAKGSVTPTYVSSMHRWLRKQLESASSSLTQPNSSYGQQIQALLRQPDDATPAQLRAQSDKLKQIEKSLESA